MKKLKICDWCSTVLESFSADYGDLVTIEAGICESCHEMERLAMRQRRGATQ